MAKCRALFCWRKPPLIGCPGPLSSQILRVYVAWASGSSGCSDWYASRSHTTCVAVPSMTPFEGPTGYVFPLSQTADTVRCVGVARREKKLHEKVIGWFVAILKYEVAVCGGCTTVRPPAGAVGGIERESVGDVIAKLMVCLGYNVFTLEACWREVFGSNEGKWEGDGFNAVLNVKGLRRTLPILSASHDGETLPWTIFSKAERQGQYHVGEVRWCLFPGWYSLLLVCRILLHRYVTY